MKKHSAKRFAKKISCDVVKIWVDGCHNPRTAGCGVYIRKSQSHRQSHSARVLHPKFYLAEGVELLALILAFHKIKPFTSAIVHCDCLPIVEKLNAGRDHNIRLKKNSRRHLYQHLLNLIRTTHNQVQIKWVSRESNHWADYLSRVGAGTQI